MSITTIVLSKDRPAQLDLLLRSIEKNGGGYFERPIVIYRGLGYTYLVGNPRVVRPARAVEEDQFEEHARFYLSTADEFVCFMCDDGILYRRPNIDPARLLGPDILCFSLRLGANTNHFYPGDFPQAVPFSTFPCWDWTDNAWETAGDFYYPGSLDAHIFRTADAQRMLDGRTFPNPTALECALVEGCNDLADERPLMACYPHSVYVGNPINRVSEQSNVRYGQTYPVTAEECNRRFLAGERIDLNSLDFSKVNGAHTEIKLVWK